MYKKNGISMLFVAVLMCSPVLAYSATDTPSMAEERSIELPAANTIGGMPLMQALAARKSTRNLSSEALGLQDISNILWSAAGVNRRSGKLTIPTAHNKQNIRLYMVTDTGVWIYDAKEHMIHKIMEDDFTKKFNDAPLTLLFSAEEDPYSNMYVGSMYQNVGLYCASAGLGNVVREHNVDFMQDAIAPFLPSGYSVRISQSIGKM